MRCADCKKEQRDLYSLWDRVRLFFFHRFHEDIIDLSNDKFTQGFGEGYKEGYKTAVEKKLKTDNLSEILQSWEK